RGRVAAAAARTAPRPRSRGSRSPLAGRGARPAPACPPATPCRRATRAPRTPGTRSPTSGRTAPRPGAGWRDRGRPAHGRPWARARAGTRAGSRPGARARARTGRRAARTGSVAAGRARGGARRREARARGRGRRGARRCWRRPAPAPVLLLPEPCDHGPVLVHEDRAGLARPGGPAGAVPALELEARFLARVRLELHLLAGGERERALGRAGDPGALALHLAADQPALRLAVLVERDHLHGQRRARRGGRRRPARRGRRRPRRRLRRLRRLVDDAGVEREAAA